MPNSVISTKAAPAAIGPYSQGIKSQGLLFCSGQIAIDPAKVTRVALENAASIAGMFLTTECVIVEKKEDKPMPAMAPGMGGMDGMM